MVLSNNTKPVAKLFIGNLGETQPNFFKNEPVRRDVMYNVTLDATAFNQIKICLEQSDTRGRQPTISKCASYSYEQALERLETLVRMEAPSPFLIDEQSTCLAGAIQQPKRIQERYKTRLICYYVYLARNALKIVVDDGKEKYYHSISYRKLFTVM